MNRFLRLRTPDRIVLLTGRFAWVLLAVVVLVLLVFNQWTNGAIREATVRAQAYGTESDAFLQAKFAATDQSAAEWQYWTEPAPEVRARHAVAGALFETSLRNALASHGGDRSQAPDEELSTLLLVATHASYQAAIGRLFDALDAGDVALARQIDNEEVDPAIREIVATVDAQAVKHRTDAMTALAELSTTEELVSAAGPVVRGVGLALVVLIGLVMRGYQSQVRRGGQRFRSLVQNASDAVAIVDEVGRITYVSPAATRVLLRNPTSMMGTNMLDLVHADDVAAARALLRDASMSPDRPITVEIRLAIDEDEVRDFEVIAINLLGERAVKGIVINFRDVSEHKAFERELKHRAFHDELTGLPNRALFLDRLEQAIARTDRHASGVAVLFLDLDQFKLVNDSLGHGNGDVLLAEVALRLRANVRKGETLARLGGDEFTILLDDMAADDEAIGVAERVLASLEAPVVIGDHEIAVTASIGIALAVPGRTSADTLLRNADLAMYQAKGDGRACYRLFDDGMAASAQDRLGLREDLRRGLDRGEFRVFYQPIVSLADRSIVEFEALVRWERPDHGLTLPSQFIPAAEETGLIVPLGQWVLEEACRQGAAWRDREPGRELTMSVNLSARQFQHPALVADISAALARTGFAATSLKLEITESAAMKDPVATARTLGELTALGIRIAIDDFGTGYSSLSYLRRFPIDTLKIDRSFVSDLGEGAQGTAIARSIVALARTLHVRVTAEGVETVVQEAILRRIGCDLAQGYLFGSPEPASRAGRFEVEAPEIRRAAPGESSLPGETRAGRRHGAGRERPPAYASSDRPV